MLMHAEVVYSGVNMVHLDGKEAIAPKVARTQSRPKMGSSKLVRAPVYPKWWESNNSTRSSKRQADRMFEDLVGADRTCCGHC